MEFFYNFERSDHKTDKDKIPGASGYFFLYGRCKLCDIICTKVYLLHNSIYCIHDETQHSMAGHDPGGPTSLRSIEH